MTLPVPLPPAQPHARPSGTPTCGSPRAHRRALLRRRGSVAVLAVGATGLVGAGALASWTTTSTTNSGTVTAATAAVELIDANGSTFGAQMPDLLPGDYFYRYVDLRNDGTASSSFTGLITATGDLAGALTAQVDRCSIAWTSGGTCLGAITSQAAEAPVDQVGLAVTYGAIGSGTGAVAHERYRFKLSETAPMSLQGKTGVLAISVTGDSTGGRDRTLG
jgi:hypothetical protein